MKRLGSVYELAFGHAEDILNTDVIGVFDICTDVQLDSHMSARLPNGTLLG